MKFQKPKLRDTGITSTSEIYMSSTFDLQMVINLKRLEVTSGGMMFTPRSMKNYSINCEIT
jgi:hypothetical protein